MVEGNHYATALGRTGPKGSTAGSKEGEVVLSLLLNGLHLQALDVLGIGLFIEWALEVPLDSASQMVVGQQFSASARATEQLSSISVRQAACQTLALLISAGWWVSASQMVQAERAFASLMTSVVSDSI